LYFFRRFEEKILLVWKNWKIQDNVLMTDLTQSSQLLGDI
jgi:hypothetical protein